MRPRPPALSARHEAFLAVIVTGMFSALATGAVVTFWLDHKLDQIAPCAQRAPIVLRTLPELPPIDPVPGLELLLRDLEDL